MSRHIFRFISVVILISCNKKQGSKAVIDVSRQNIYSKPSVTVLAGLPDSLQPKTILFEQTPKVQQIRIPVKIVNYDIPLKSGLEAMEFSPTEKVKGHLFSAMQNITTEQGLPLDVISCSYADKKGNLWFGTNVNGACRYDGNSFTNYTISQGLNSNNVNSIMEDRAGNMWFATNNGVSKFDGYVFSNFGNFRNININSLVEDRDRNLWFGTQGSGLYKYAGDSVTIYTKSSLFPGNDVYALEEDQNGILWIGTDNGLCQYDRKKFTRITSDDVGVSSLCIDKNGNVWGGTAYGHIKYNKEGITTYPYYKGTQQVTGMGSSFVYEDRFGNIWMRSSQEGNVNIYDGKAISSFDRSNGLLFTDIHGLVQDKSGNSWLGSSANGIAKYSGTAFQRLTEMSYRSILEDKSGNIWLAGYGGAITKFDGENLINYRLSSTFRSLLQDRSGNIWIGTEQRGLIKFDEKSYTFYTDLNGLADNSVTGLLQDKGGNIWIGTSKGLSKFDGKSFTNFTKRQGLADDFVWCILEDKPGEFWIGTEGGLSHFDGKIFTNYTRSQGLGFNDIKSIIKDKDGNLWIGTYGGGVSRYDGKSFYHFSTEQGLQDNVVTQVSLTKEGNIVLGTNNGIAIFTGFKPDSTAGLNHADDRATKKNYPVQNKLSNDELKKYLPVFEIYNSKTGYPVKDVNRGHHAILQDSKGKLWIATGSAQSGLIRFDYSLLNKNNNPPQVNLLSVKVNNELICWHDLLDKTNNNQQSKPDSVAVSAAEMEEITIFGKLLNGMQRKEMQKKYKRIKFDSVSRFYPIPQNLVLPFQHNRITIDFAAIEPASPSLIQYQYKLEGYDNNWSTPSNITSATYGNMHEGTYHFYVKAQSPSGIWSEPVKYSFVVLSPWYRTWWAYVSYALMFLFALRVFSKWRERNLRSDKEKLEAKVEQRTNELNRTLDNLKSTQSQLIQSEKLASLGELTAGIAHEIQNPLNFVNNFSELNKELIEELQQELRFARIDDAIAVSNDIKENEGKINYHGKRADAIVKGMLNHSRTSTGIKELTDINALADEYLRLSYHGLRAKDKTFNATMKTDFDDTIGSISIISQDIGRVLLNLFNNAFYVVTEKKKEQLTGYDPTISISTKKINGKVEIRVKDNGKGIPPKVLDKIFQPFFTTKPTGQGTGLGLSLSYDIIKVHGGEIRAESKEGEGAEFIIQLPANV